MRILLVAIVFCAGNGFCAAQSPARDPTQPFLRANQPLASLVGGRQMLEKALVERQVQQDKLKALIQVRKVNPAINPFVQARELSNDYYIAWYEYQIVGFKLREQSIIDEVELSKQNRIVGPDNPVGQSKSLRALQYEFRNKEKRLEIYFSMMEASAMFSEVMKSEVYKGLKKKFRTNHEIEAI